MPRKGRMPKFHELRKKHAVFARYYRRGEMKRWRTRPDEVGEAEDRIWIPQPGPWPGYDSSRSGFDYAGQLAHGDRIRLKTLPDHVKVSTEEDVANILENKYTLSTLKPYNLKFQKVVGRGGYGVVVLYELQDEEGWKIRDVVVKASLSYRGRKTIGNEKKLHKLLKRAYHCVQQVDVPRNLGDWSIGYDLLPYRKALPDVAENTDILVLEYLQRGDLRKWLIKMSEEGENARFPDRVLWYIFSCLYRACVAMAYPPRYCSAYKDSDPWDPEWEDGGPIYEAVPETDDITTQDLCHLDLDSSNILLGGDCEFGADYQRIMPDIKLGDFGVSRPLFRAKIGEQGTEKESILYLWEARTQGKWAGNLTPEQFHPEWDHIDRLPSREKETSGWEPKVAGNFSYKTNFYSIGLIMWQLVTLLKVPEGNLPWPMKYENGPGEEPDIWYSYGTYVLDQRFGHVDEDLREMIVQCMMDNPDHRPSFRELGDEIKEGLKRSNEQEDSERGASLKNFVMNFFAIPPPSRSVDDPTSSGDEMEFSMSEI